MMSSGKYTTSHASLSTSVSTSLKRVKVKTRKPKQRKKALNKQKKKVPLLVRMMTKRGSSTNLPLMSAGNSSLVAWT